MRSTRIFIGGGPVAFRALFNWRQPSVYIPTMLGSPIFQLLFFVWLGRYSGLADDRFFVIGNAVCSCGLATLFGMVMMLSNERQLGTLSALLATPASRLAVFYGRAIPLVGHGLLVTVVAFSGGFVLLDVRVPVGALPAIAGALVITVASSAMFGLALGTVAMRINDLWLTTNTTNMLLLLICGAEVPIGRLPSWMATVGRVLPFTHGLQAIRALAAGARLADVGGQIGAEALVGTGYAVLGYALLRLFEAENRRRATLNT
jgi:ABC-2 type transport system permease protein